MYLTQNQTNTPRFFYGWVVVVAAAITYFFSGPGQTFSFSVFIDPILAEFGWSRGLISGVYSGATLAAGAGLPFVGRFIDRHGHRRMLVAIAVLFGGALLLLSWAATPAMFAVGFFLARMLGQGSMTLLPGTLVPQWFQRQRGKALALAALGLTASSALLPPLNTWLIEHWGWRFSWRLWAVALWAVMVPLALLVVRNRPEEMGLRPDNRPVEGSRLMDGSMSVAETGPAVGSRSTAGPGPSAAPTEEPTFTLAEALRTPSFWLLLLITALPGLVTTGLIFHLVSAMALRGLSPEQTAAIFPIAAMMQLPFMFTAGAVADRIPVRYLLAGWLGALALSLLWLLVGPGTGMVVTFGILLGAVQAMGPIVSGTLWPGYFGRRHLGSIQGAASTAMVAGTSLGPLPFGLVYDHFGSYNGILWALFLVAAGLAALAATIRPPAHPRRAAS